MIRMGLDTYVFIALPYTFFTILDLVEVFPGQRQENTKIAQRRLSSS